MSVMSDLIHSFTFFLSVLIEGLKVAKYSSSVGGTFIP
mgnify:CR=1 FL=1